MRQSAATSPASPDDPFVRAVLRSLPGYQDTQTDVFGQLGYTPTPRQAELHAATEWDVLYGGAAGGGKTRAAVMDDLRDAIRYPGIRIGAFRRSYPELAESLIRELAAVEFAAALGATWNGSERELRFPNGSSIVYRYAETLKDASRRQGGEYQKLTLDERGLTAPGVVEFLYTRIRSGRRSLPVLGVRSYANPGGVGHGANKARYVDATAHGERVYQDGRGRTVRFIPAKLSDNPHVNPEYAADLQGLSDPALKAALLDGSWDSFAGQYFPEWRHDRHVVYPVGVPRSWRRAAGIDWGYANPWCVLWGAVDPDGRLWIYREVYRTRVGERDQARTILALEHAAADMSLTRYADPSMWSTRGDAPAIAAEYAAEGVGLVPAQNDRVAGWQRLHGYLADGPACAIHRYHGWQVCPRLHVFSTCENLIRTLPDQVHDAARPEDLDTGGDDHGVDALRYMVMGVSRAPGLPTVTKPARRDPEEIDPLTANF
jgi:hypothetical protein